jgi:hypothetical protein
MSAVNPFIAFYDIVVNYRRKSVVKLKAYYDDSSAFMYN